MGDLADDYRVMNEMRKERRDKRYKENMEILHQYQGRISINKNKNVILFREHRKPKADFYPGSGRWKVNNKMYSGGAKSFLKWYEKQNNLSV